MPFNEIKNQYGRVPGCRLPCCEGYFQTQHLSNLAKPCLANDIHPLFYRTNFGGFHGFKYAPLDQVLRLASHFIEASLPFFHTLLFGTYRLIPELDSKGRKQFEYDHEISFKRLTRLNTQRTRDALVELAKFVTITFRDDHAGRTVPKCRITTSEMYEGTSSQVLLCRKQYEDIRAGTLDGISERWTMFDLARTLVHEIAHVAMIAAASKTENNHYFFKDQPVSEDGYALETFLFGGLLDEMLETTRGAYGHAFFNQHDPVHDLYTLYGCTLDNFPGMIVLEHWPIRSQVMWEVERRWFVGLRAELPEVETMWHIDFRFLDDLFQPRFWEEEYGRPGVAALHPARLTGIRSRWIVDGKDSRRKFLTLQDSNVTPAGYRITPGGLLIRRDHFVKTVR